MRKIKVIHDKITLTDDVEMVYEKRITPFGSSAKVGAPKAYIGRRAFHNPQRVIKNFVPKPVSS